MRAVLTLQVPGDDWQRGRILAASSDPELLRAFCHSVLQQRLADMDTNSGDIFDKELALLELEQLRARLTFALGEEV